MVNQGFSKQILQRGTEEGRSFEDYQSLHKYCSQKGSKTFREYIANCAPTTTDGGGTAKAIASSTAVTNKGKAETELWGACDADTAANRLMKATVHYFDADGNKHNAKITLGAAADTVTQFVDAETGLIGVSDFYCFNQEDYGKDSLAPTYGKCIETEVAIGAATNFIVGIQAGLIAGIADPEIAFAHINTTKVNPLLADIYGVGSIWGEREADDTSDDSLVTTITYNTPWSSELKTATCTNTTTHTAIIRYVDADGTYVGNFYRVRNLITTKILIKAHHVVDHDGATHYAVIEALNNISCHTSFYSMSADIESYIGYVKAGWSTLTDVAIIKISYVPFGSTIAVVKQRTFEFNIDIQINERLAPNTPVSLTIEDGAVGAGLVDVDITYIEKL